MNTTRILILAGLAAAFSPAVSNAQTVNEGYLGDQRGDVVKSGTGLCWRTQWWTPALAIEGCDTVAMKKAEAAPVRIAAAPPPAPAPAPRAPTTMTKKVTFSAEALFAFDRADLKPEGKAILDQFARDVSGDTYDAIVSTGHADRFGSMQYNQRLSERRANTVNQYLAGRGIASSRMSARGMGETQPVTKPGECQGKKSAKVIACLQPDRRVDVEMTVTK